MDAGILIGWLSNLFKEELCYYNVTLLIYHDDVLQDFQESMYSHHRRIYIFISIEIRLLNINKMAPKVKVGTELLIKFLNPVSARQLKIICYKILQGILCIRWKLIFTIMAGLAYNCCRKWLLAINMGIIMGD